MTGDRDDEEPREPAWHERTSTLAWASVAALVALWIVYLAISFIARQFSGPDEVPQYFLDPDQTTSHSFSTTATTTSESYSSTSPPQTTDINPGDTTTNSTDTSVPNATTHRRSSTTTNDGDEDTTSTTRRPRFNETRRNVFPFG